MNLYIVGWKFPSDRIPKAVAELSRMIEIYPQLDPATLWHYQSPSGTLFIASMHTSNEAAAPRRYVYQNEDEVAFYSGLPIDPDGTYPAHRAKELSAHWSRLAENLEGHFVLFRADKKTESLELVTDFIGFEQVYYRKKEGMWLISNSVGLIERISAPSALDPLGVSLFLSTGTVSDHRTLRSDIRGIPGGQHWTWKKGGTDPNKTSYFSPSSLARDAYVQLTQAFIRELSDEMLQLCRSLNKNFDQITCSLTGGRDSRLLAALLIHAGIPAQFYTSGAPTSADVKTASLITKTLDLPHTVDQISSEDVLEDWDNLCERFVLQNDGLVSLWQVADVLRQKESIDHLDLFFWGAGGEIGRGYDSHPDLFFSKGTAEQVTAYLTKKRVHSRGGLITEEATSLAKDYVGRFVRKYTEAGFTPLDIPDLSQLLEGNINWFSNTSRNSVMMADLFSPFYSRSFVNAVYALSPKQRYTEPLHYAIIRNLVPELHRLPFEKEPWRPQQPTINLLYMYAATKLGEFSEGAPTALRNVKRWIAPRQKKVPVFDKISWLEIKLKQLREMCLDQRESSLWDYVDRPIFERVSASVTNPEVTHKQKLKLYSIATVFYYEAIR